MLTRVIRTLWEDRVSKGDGRPTDMAHSWIRVYISTSPIKGKYHKEREEKTKRIKEKSIYIKYINRFVKYSRREEALLAVEEMAGYRIGNKTLMCKLSSSATSPASCNIYIKPLPTSSSEGIPPFSLLCLSSHSTSPDTTSHSSLTTLTPSPPLRPSLILSHRYTEGHVHRVWRHQHSQNSEGPKTE